MIRVLNIISDTNIGGAGRVLLNYLRCADRERFETAVALPKGSLLLPELQALGARTHEVDGMADRSYHRDDVRALEALIRDENPDIVHTHGALSGRIAGRRCGRVVIYTRHSAFPVPARLRYPPGRWVNKYFNEHYADHIIAVSPAAAENLTDAGISPRYITTILNGVAPVERLDAAALAPQRAAWGLEPDDFVLGILARLEPYKGHMDVLDAVRALADQGRRCRLLIAGTGPAEAALRRRTAELGLEDEVVFTGFLREVAPFLSLLDVQLNASYGTEATSLSLLEGFSMGVPAIVSDYGGNPCLVTDGDNGLLFPTRDAAALAGCIGRLMDEPETRAQMSRRAEAAYHKRFTAERFARKIESVYCQTLKGAEHGTKKR